jgi:hypothetical protein
LPFGSDPIPLSVKSQQPYVAEIAASSNFRDMTPYLPCWCRKNQ